MNYDSLDQLPEKYRTQAAEKLNKREKKQAENMRNVLVRNEARRKYGNVTTESNGIKFDSKKEARRYEQLMAQFRCGEIDDLKLQHHFTLQGAFKTASGKSIGKIEYVADFTYRKEGEFIIEDVKSEITRKNQVYILKKKMMAERGYTISEV